MPNTLSATSLAFRTVLVSMPHLIATCNLMLVMRPFAPGLCSSFLLHMSMKYKDVAKIAGIAELVLARMGEQLQAKLDDQSECSNTSIY